MSKPTDTREDYVIRIHYTTESGHGVFVCDIHEITESYRRISPYDNKFEYKLGTLRKLFDFILTHGDERDFEKIDRISREKPIIATPWGQQCKKHRRDYNDHRVTG